MFNLFKSKAKRSGITIELSPMETDLLKISFDIAHKRMEMVMKIHGLPDHEKIAAVQNWPDQKQVYLLVFNHHWAKELAKKPSSITLPGVEQSRMFIDTVTLMQSIASQQALIDGTKVDLVRYGGSVGVVNAVIARIKAKAGIS
jgi:hypothetical protein